MPINFFPLTLSSTFFQIFRYSLSYTICIESYVVYSTLKNCNIDALHWIVAPQLGGGRQNNYSTKTKQAAVPMNSLAILS
jgi:hypothetical protein